MSGRVVLVDGKRAVGGGQVVLAELANRVSRRSTTAVVADSGVVTRLPFAPRVDTATPLAAHLRSTAPLVLVANCYPSLLPVLRVARLRRCRGLATTTVGILHSYPPSAAKRAVTTALLARTDVVVPVEPGLRSLSPRRAHELCVLGVGRRFPAVDPSDWTGTVKALGRPDVVKGLHLLPELVTRVPELQGRLQVALGEPLRESSYAADLRAGLAPWSVGPRSTSEWLQPGDVYLSTSLLETAALATQEAMARGAFVVAPRVGGLVRLAQETAGVVLYAPGEVAAAARALRRVMGMGQDEFVRGCRDNHRVVDRQCSTWYEQVTGVLAGLAGAA